MNRRLAYLLFGLEAVILSSFVLTTRCANYREIFVGNDIYFVDADCYARMTRVRLCAQHPGLILGHHSFENYPQGTQPHTTAPLDYAILSLSIILRPFTARSIETGWRAISPVAAMITGLFLLWWARKMRFRFRWAMLGLFVLSPILVHGTALGRPDHQSVLILLVTAAVCADWSLLNFEARGWKIVSGLTWGLAIWVSAYEPLILFAISSLTVSGLSLRKRRISLTNEAVNRNWLFDRGLKWFVCAVVLLIAMLIERRVPSFAVFGGDPLFARWSRTIGELAAVPLLSATWFHWLGWLLLAVPILVALAYRRELKNRIPLTIVVLLVVTFLLTLWQSRWSYFLAVIFVITLPALLGVMRSRTVGWILFVISLWPVLRDWDTRLWPDPLTVSRQVEQRREAIELRELSAQS